MACESRLIDFKEYQEQIIDLVQEIGDAYESDQYSPSIIKSRIEEMLKLPYFIIGLFKDGKLIGLSGALELTKIYSGKQIEVDNFIISKSERRNNYGSILMEAIKKEAKERGCKTIELNVYVDNAPALNLYKKQGFTHIGNHCMYQLN